MSKGVTHSGSKPGINDSRSLSVAFSYFFGLIQDLLLMLKPLWGNISFQASSIQPDKGLCPHHPCQPLVL
eukprot:8732419-Karenia_brevis.AAC.1